MDDDSGTVRDAAPAERASARKAWSAIALDALRHGGPLIPLYFLHANIAAYLVLTAFDLAFGLLLIVSTMREATDPTTVDPRSRWPVARLAAILLLAVFYAFIAAVLVVPIGAPAFLFGLAHGTDWRAAVTNAGFWVPLGGMALLAALRAQLAFEAVTTPGARGEPSRRDPVIGDIEADRRRSVANYAAQVTLIATYALLSYLLLEFGLAGAYALPPLYAALLVFYNTRPDLAQRIFPELWQGTRRIAVTPSLVPRPDTATRHGHAEAQPGHERR